MSLYTICNVISLSDCPYDYGGNIRVFDWDWQNGFTYRYPKGSILIVSDFFPSGQVIVKNLVFFFKTIQASCQKYTSCGVAYGQSFTMQY